MILLECVPNFSEGRDTEKIQKIVNSVKSAKVLDLHSDPDHNRSVLTMVADKDSIVDAAFELASSAIELIDINKHQGVHPFIGSVDVIPFIPLKDASMADAALCAKELGEQIWNRLEVPVYLYGEASILPHRSNLAEVRKGGLAGLAGKKPDIGTVSSHPTAGAVAIGARNFLIAYNINLDTDNLKFAQMAAKAIREKHGGLPGVRALGVPLASRRIVQITINITDHKETSIKQVFDQVASLCEEFAVRILESELVGLMPGSAYSPGLEKSCKIANFSNKSILENNLQK